MEKALPVPLCWIFKERLRLGTISLMHALRELGAEVWIYTTSYRSERYIRALFRCYGISLDRVINGETHAKEVQSGKAEAMPSKYPSKYRISLHVDDDISVAQNGSVYGFRVFTVGAQDDVWTEQLLDAVRRLPPQNA